MNLSVAAPDYSRDFNYVGRVNLYLGTYPNDGSSKRHTDIALVRDIGMVILSEKTKLRKAFWPGNTVGSTWSSFTLLIEVLNPKGEQSWLRAIETPAHDDVSYELIKDLTERKKARHTLQKEVGSWVWSVLKRKCAPHDSLTEELPIFVFDTLFSTSNTKTARDSLSGPKNQDWVPSSNVVAVRRSRSQRHYALFEQHRKVRAIVPGQEQSDPDTESGKMRNDGIGRSLRRKASKVPTTYPEVVFSGLRLREVGQETHALAATFSTPVSSVHNISLKKLTEDGKEVSVGLQKIVMGERVFLPGCNGVDIEDWPDVARVHILIFTQEPVAGKTFCLVQGK